jgi:PilZ domain
MYAERRRSTRIAARFLVEWDAGEFFAPAEAADVSPQGLFIETARLGQVAQLVRVRLHIPDGEPALECYAWIRWQRGDEMPGMGLQLFAMSDAERNRWGAFYMDCYRRRQLKAA